jgi:hypothetical protein
MAMAIDPGLPEIVQIGKVVLSGGSTEFMVVEYAF